MFSIGGQHTTSRPKGHTWLYDSGGGPDVEHDTLQCVHCQAHWEVKPGSGRKRGWCMRCNGPTCGKPCCDTCMPALKWIELVEAGLDPLAPPVSVSVPGVVTGGELC